MRCRGFTLLEVVVTLAILIAIGALVMPSVSGQLAGESGRSLAREITAGVGLARTDAIRASEPLRLVFVADASGRVVRLVSRPLEPAAAPASAPRFVGPVLDDPGSATMGDPGAGDEVLVELPRGARVSRQPPASEQMPDQFGGDGLGGSGSGAFGGAELGGLDAGGLAGEDLRSGLTVGVLLPTGGAVAGAPVYVTLAGSWTLQVVLDPWTGDATVTRWQPPAPEDDWATTSDGEGDQAASGAADPGTTPDGRATTR